MKSKNLFALLLAGAFLYACGKPAYLSTSATSPDSPTPDASKPPYQPHEGKDLPTDTARNFAHLINNFAKAKVEPTPWAGYWWPFSQNGIASATYSDRRQSPAGKYDAARGKTTHAQEWEHRFHGVQLKGLQGWWGHCNGWSAAAALFPEPRESVKVNGIVFSAADIKALVTEAAMWIDADFFGERDETDNINSLSYKDTVPDQYFLVLTNYIGKLKRPVLIDRYTGSQVWNQPVAGYKFEYPKPSDYLGAHPEAPQVYRILVTSRLWWMNDGISPDRLSSPFNFEEDDSSDLINSRVLKMELWLDGPVVFDSQGKITSSGDLIVTRQGKYMVGGVWKMNDVWDPDGWPDYMWVPKGLSRPSDLNDQDYVNPYIDINWIKAHLLVPGGADDTSVIPVPIDSPPPTTRPSERPSPQPSPSIRPSPRAIEEFNRPNPQATS